MIGLREIWMKDGYIEIISEVERFEKAGRMMKERGGR